MKILFIVSHTHHKNFNFILNCKKINFHVIHSAENIDSFNLSEFSAVFSPVQPIDVSKYPNTKFIFGPHFSIFPESDKMNIIKGSNSIYIQPSQWAHDAWFCNPICYDTNLKTFAFGVDTDKFSPTKSISERNNVFIYFKNRSPDDLIKVESFLMNKNLNLNYRVFSYMQKYNEQEYLNYLKNCKFALWISGHESQGFALEEALSCDVPLLVWNVKSMNQEYGSNYDDITATSIPYWDDRCGEYYYNIDDLDKTFETFLSKLESYKPREYVLENLSVEVCENNLINMI